MSKERIGGYFITDEIEKRLAESPDYLVKHPFLGLISIVFGQRREEGEPNFSAYCLIKNGEVVRKKASGGITFESALDGLGLEIKALVTKEIQKTKEI